MRIAVKIDADAEILPAATSATIYAICREALTNARRHASNASSAVVTVQKLGDSLSVTIVDDGATPISGRSNGHGLTSMTERAAAIGGSLTAGPNPAGGWRVAVQLPVHAR